MARDPRTALPDSIHTRRLRLRAPMRADVPALADLANNRKIHEVLTRLPFPYTRADAIGFVEIVAQRSDTRAYAVTLEDGLIGVLSLMFAPDAPPELGYWLGEPYWGQGFMTEAAGALVGAARETGLFPEIRAHALMSNTRSRNLLARLGFTEIGQGPIRSGSGAGQPGMFYRLESFL